MHRVLAGVPARGLEEEDRSEGRSAFPPAPPGFCGEGRRGGCQGVAGTPLGSQGKFEPFPNSEKAARGTGPNSSSKGAGKKAQETFRLERKDKGISLKKKKINKQTKIQSPAGSCGGLGLIR